MARGDLSSPRGGTPGDQEVLDRIRGRWMQERVTTLAEVVAAIDQNRRLYERDQERLRQVEEAHEALQKTQEKMVATATSKLAALGTLAAGVAHELNQPLTAIVGLVDLLRESPDDPIRDHLDNIDLILAASERLGSIVDNVRTFGRQDALHFESIPPSLPALRAHELLRERMRVDQIEFRLVDHLHENVRIQADPNRLQQVFINLLANARDALRELPPDRVRELDVEIDLAGGCIEYRVSDNGKGIPEAVVALVFDPFFTTKQPGHGTGLGLSVSRAILEEHRGTLEHGRGNRRTTFICRLPTGADPCSMAP